MLVWGTTSIDLDAHQVRVDGEARDLTRLEVEALRLLAARRGQVVLRETLEREVWGFRAGVRSEAVPVAMRRLRSKIGRDDVLASVTGRGWRLEHGREAYAIPVLPRFATPLTGRGALLDSIDDLRARGWRVVTLRGPGGVGKSRVLWEVARRSSGVAVPLVLDAPVASTDRLRDALAGALHLDRSDRETLLRWFAALDQPVLVIDDADLAADAVRDFADDLLAQVPDSAVLLATRAPIGVQGEAIVEVPPLSRDEARTFFIDRLGRRPGAAEGAALDAVIDRLDRLPLALELYAPEAALGLSVLADALLAPDLPSRLRAVVERSWATLPDGARAVLLACSAYAGPFDLEAALAAADGDRASLAVLHERSVLHLAPDGRFAVLRSVRSFCRQQAGFDAAAARAHRHVRAATEALAARVLSDTAGAIAGMRALLPHVEQVVAEGRPDDAERVALAAATVLEHTGPDALLLALLDRVSPADRSRADAVRTGRARALQHLRRSEEAVRAAIDGVHTPEAEAVRVHELHLLGSYEASLDRADALDAAMPADNPLRVTVRVRGYWSAFALGRPTAERGRRVDAAVDLAERLGARPHLPHAWRARAHHLSQVGDTLGARAALGRAMQAAERNGQHRLVAWLWGTLAQVELRHDVSAAAVALERAVALARDGGDSFQFIAAIQLAGCRILLDQPQAALDALRPVFAGLELRPRLHMLATAYRGAALLGLGRGPEGRLALDAVDPADLAFGAPGATPALGVAYLELLRAEEALRAVRLGTGDAAPIRAALDAVAEVAATPAGEEALGLLIARLRTAL